MSPSYADRHVQALANFVVGANEADTHLVDVSHGRDFAVAAEFADLALRRAGRPLPALRHGARDRARHRGRPRLQARHEVLGGDAAATFLDEAGAKQPMIMGCYGIGIGRTVAAAIEQNHDADGIVWPLPLAPFQVPGPTLSADGRRRPPRRPRRSTRELEARGRRRALRRPRRAPGRQVQGRRPASASRCAWSSAASRSPTARSSSRCAARRARRSRSPSRKPPPRRSTWWRVCAERDPTARAADAGDRSAPPRPEGRRGPRPTAGRSRCGWRTSTRERCSSCSVAAGAAPRSCSSCGAGLPAPGRTAARPSLRGRRGSGLAGSSPCRWAGGVCGSPPVRARARRLAERGVPRLLVERGRRGPGLRGRGAAGRRSWTATFTAIGAAPNGGRAGSRSSSRLRPCCATAARSPSC